MKSLESQVALVTGAASGIGRAVARLLSREGARVGVADLNVDGAAAVAEEIRAGGGESLALRLDVSDETAWDEAALALQRRWSRWDILVNAAGIVRAAPVADTPLAEWRAVHAVNLDGVFLGTRAAIRVMAGAGGGVILNVASASGLRATGGAAAYASSKAAVIHFTRAAALECRQARNGIRINAIAPAGVRTPLWRSTPMWRQEPGESEEQAWARLDPAGDFHTPEEIAGIVLYFVSEAGAALTAAVLPVDRGYSA